MKKFPMQDLHNILPHKDICTSITRDTRTQRGQENVHSRPFGAKVKYEGSYISLPMHAFTMCTRTGFYLHIKCNFMILIVGDLMSINFHKA